MSKILQIFNNMSKGVKLGVAGGCAAIIVIVVVLVVVLGGSSSGETPGKKVMTDTRAYLSQLQRHLDDNADPRLPCRIVPGTKGINVRADDCPEPGDNRWWDEEPWNDPRTPWPSTEIESGPGGGPEGGGPDDDCGCDNSR